MMLAPMLRVATTDPATLKMLDTVESCATRGAEVIKQILTFSRGMQGEKGPVELRRLFDDVAGIIRETFPRSITVVVQSPQDLWPVEGEATHLHQVLMNLSVNARDAMPDGGTITIEAENAVIDEVKARTIPNLKPGRYVSWSLSDAGLGMSREQIDRIFDPFFSTKAVGKGTGLGLSTVLGIVRSHGGWIDVTSDMGGGSTFYVLLPASEDTSHAAKDATIAQAPDGHGELILVVDDEAAVRSIVQRVLEHFNYRTLMAPDGKTALALYEKNKDEIKAVVTDMDMPPPDGSALIRAINTISPGATIVRMSGHPDEAGTGLDPKLFLQKPFAPKELLNMLHSVLAANPAQIANGNC
jgi:CheY-like chemotaxis protein